MDNGNIVLGALTMKRENRMTSNQWESTDGESTHIPTESFGLCRNKRCLTVGVLGDGLCEQCWDKHIKVQPSTYTAQTNDTPQHIVPEISDDVEIV